MIPFLRVAVFSLISFLYINVSYGQDSINYGNNAAAGKYYNIRDIKMYCETYGNGVPLLMIHGNGGNISAFKNNIPFFSKKYKVIAVDSRAQGKSVDPNDSISFEMMADDFAALLDTMHIKSAYVIGWSDGGINALLLAMRHPDKVIKLASTGANLWPDSTAIIPSLWLDEKKFYEDSIQNKTLDSNQKQQYKMFLLDWFQPNVSLKELKKIKCPSLIICGDNDLIRLDHTKAIYQNIPKANLWVVPNSGHATLIEHKDEFDNKVNAFFQNPFQKD